MIKEYKGKAFDCIKQEPVRYTGIRVFSREKARDVLRFHQSLPVYKKTSLLSLEQTASMYGVRSIFVKDESGRFGLKAFKGLGGSYCMYRILCRKLSLDPAKSDYRTFLREDLREKCCKIEFVTATDGNHGKGVSWAAKLFGCKARVFMPAGTVEARRRAVEDAGAAIAEITEWNYDRTVQYAASFAEERGSILIQDTAWDGYEQYPQWIMEGYLTLAEEAAGQMGGIAPTHVFLQAGVGSMAGAVEAYCLNRFNDSPPGIAIVEAEPAACIYRSVLAGDGKAHSIEGSPSTIMAGLNCGTPCSTIWPVLRDTSTWFCACRDSVSEKGMLAYARPEGSDPSIVSGESGAVTYGLVRTILEDESLRDLFHINRDSVILLINTEGDTDPEGYLRVVGHPEKGHLFPIH